MEPDKKPRQLRRDVLKHGYEPVPLEGKACLAKGWTSGEITPERLDAWADERPSATNTGLRTGWLVAFDVDVKDRTLTEALVEAIEAECGSTPLERFGSKGAALLYRAADPKERKRTLATDGPDKLEVLAKGQQLAAFGTHPDTGKPFKWTRGKSPLDVALSALPEVAPDQIEAALERAAEVFEKHGRTVGPRGVSNNPVERAAASREPEAKPLAEVSEILRHVDPDCGYDQWRNVGFVLRDEAITGEDGDELDDWERLSLYENWSRGELRGKAAAKYADNDDKGEYSCQKIWGSKKSTGPAVGWGTLVNLAKASGYEPPRRTAEEVFGDMNVGDAAPAAEGVASEKNGDGTGRPEYVHRGGVRLDVTMLKAARPRARRVGDFEGKPPLRLWVWEDYIPHLEPSVLTGPGGAGKGLLACALVNAVQGGEALFGIPTRQMNTLLVTTEDNRDELHRRFHALGGKDPDVRWLYVGGQDSILADVRDLPIEAGPFYYQLVAELEAMPKGPKFVTLDNLSSLLLGSEIDRTHAYRFVHTVVVGLQDRYQATFTTLAHPSLSGKAAGTGASGSTGWEGAFRSRLYLRCHEDDAGIIRRLSRTKANYGQQDAEDDYRTLAFDAGKLRLAREEDHTATTSAQGRADMGLYLFLRDNPGPAGEGWTKAPQSPERYIFNQTVRHVGGGKLNKKQLKGSLARLIEQDVVRVEDNRQGRKCLVVDEDKKPAPSPELRGMSDPNDADIGVSENKAEAS